MKVRELIAFFTVPTDVDGVTESEDILDFDVRFATSSGEVELLSVYKGDEDDTIWIDVGNE